MNLETKDAFPEDATHTEDVWFFGDRAVALVELKVSFEAQAVQTSWPEVLSKLNVESVRVDRTSHAAFVALPERVERSRPFLAATTTWNEELPGWASWDFRWSRGKNDSPPENIVEISREVGSFPKVLDRLGAVWPVGSPVRARVSASYLVFGKDWRFMLASPRVKGVVAGDQILKVRPTRWTINPPSGCVSEITEEFSWFREKDFILGCRGTYTLRWTPRFLNEVDGALWDGLRIFLEPRRSKSRR